jgi:signal transduction histidine kinase
VQVQFLSEEIVITVSDNGVGFSVPDETAELVNGGSLGLMGLKERAQLFGGQMDIISQAGQGTTVQVVLPREPYLPQSETYELS